MGKFNEKQGEKKEIVENSSLQQKGDRHGGNFLHVMHFDASSNVYPGMHQLIFQDLLEEEKTLLSVVYLDNINNLAQKKHPTIHRNQVIVPEVRPNPPSSLACVVCGLGNA